MCYDVVNNKYVFNDIINESLINEKHFVDPMYLFIGQIVCFVDSFQKKHIVNLILQISI